MGFAFPRRFGPLSVCLGEVETAGASVETLVVDDEQAAPVLLRNRIGRGAVYFLNAWSYPGAFDVDRGPGSDQRSPGLVGMIYRHIARENRGTYWITDDGREPGSDCDFIAYSYFPEDGSLCLQNVDFDRPHGFHLHRADGDPQPMMLDPGEFRRIRAPYGRQLGS